MSDEQLALVVERFRQYARRACDGGYRVGPENHFGPALVPDNIERICTAVDSPAFGVMLHVGHWVEGCEAVGDCLAAPWTFHTHIDWRITTTCLAEKMAMLRDAGYSGAWGVEHHTGANEYSEVAIQVATVRDVLSRW
jgi:sugar phosphate isomerase/epimerase